MPKLSPQEHKARKQASALRCLTEDGKPVSLESTSVAVHDKASSCDINRIIAKFQKTGVLDPSLVKSPGYFIDATKAVDFQEMKNRVLRVEKMFNGLDPKVRAEYGNEPATLLAAIEKAITDDATYDLLVAQKVLPPPVIKTELQESPTTGKEWVKTKNGKEIARFPYKAPAASPSAKA